MRIAFVASGGFDPSGRERVTPSLLWLVERLARRHDVHVFVLRYLREPATYALLGATVHDLGRVDGPPGLARFRMASRLAAALDREGRFDVLHAYQAMPAGVVAAGVATARAIPLVLTMDSGEGVAIADIAYGLQRRLVDQFVLRRAIAAASAVTVCTRYMATRPALARAHPHIVPIGIDTTRFHAARIDEGPPWRLVRVASLNRVKDYPLLLRTIARLGRSGDAFHVDIVGEDTVGGEVQAQAAALGVLDRLTFHGFQPTDALADLYARAHLHVVTSRHEAAGVVVLEAAAAGVATVGTPVGYVADWSPARAVAVERHSPEPMADAIDALLHDPARRADIARKAHDWTRAHDADWTAAAFERVYAGVTRR